MTRLNWDRAKAPRPTQDKSDAKPHDRLAKRANRELQRWAKGLTKRDRQRLERALQ